MGSALKLGLGVLTLVLGCLTLAQAPENAENDYRAIATLVQTKRIQEDALALQKLAPSGRLAGTPGERAAHQWLREKLVAQGWQPGPSQDFDVSIPDPSAIGTLSANSQTVSLLPLWPNLVRTSTCGISGPVIDAGDGSLEAMKGKPIQGSIVVMDFDSGERWRDAAKLGAAAVVFRAGAYDRVDSEKKWSGLPLNLPRFLAKGDLKGLVGQRATLKCRQNWLRSRSANHSFLLPGSDPSADEIWVTAYLDSMSVVPGDAPGGQASAGALALLEATRVLRSLDRKRPIRVWLLGAHFLGLQGTRELVERSFGQRPPLLTLSLDLSTDSNSMGMYARGWMLNSRQETQDPMRLMARLLRDHAENFHKAFRTENARVTLYDSVNQSDGRYWRNAIPGRFAADSEILNLAGMNGLSLISTDDPRPRFDTPGDTFESLNFDVLRTQAARVAGVLFRVSNDTTSRGETSSYRTPLDPKGPKRLALTGGYGTVAGTTVEYDPNKSFVPNVPVANAMVALQIRQRTMMGVRGLWITQADSKGHFRFTGVPPASAYVKKDQFPLRLFAFGLEEATGAIQYAPASGLFGAEDYPNVFFMNTSDRFSPLVLFRAKPLEFYGLVDPQDFQPLDELRILDATSDGAPITYGSQMARTERMLGELPDDAGIAFVLPDQRAKFLVGRGFETRMALTTPIDALTNSRIGDAAFRAAQDMGSLNRQRLNEFEKRRILAPALSRLQDQADQEFAEAKTAQDQLDWPTYFQKAQRSWALSLRVYPALLANANDLVNGVVFYLLLLIPFSVFVERLLFASRNLNRQALVTVAIFMGAFLLLKFLHPAFQIVPNPWMVFIAFVMGSLSALVASFIFGKFESGLREDRASKLGLKEVDLRRGSVAAAAFGLGLGNLRRRPLRTGLTVLTLVTMTFIVLSFTSIVPDVKLNESPMPGEARYAGLMLRNPGLEPIAEDSVKGLALEFGESALRRRMTYYGVDFQNETFLELKSGEKKAVFRSVVGLDAAEADTLRPQEALTSGRWFRAGEDDAVLLPDPIAKELGQPPFAQFSGTTYRVIGTYDPKKLGAIKDLDGDGFLTPDFTLSKNEQTRSQSLTAAFRSYVRLDPATCILASARAVQGLGGDLRTVAVRLDPAKASPALKDLMPRLRLNLYAGVQGEKGLEVRRFSVQNAQEASGFGWILIQMALASVFVLNAMIASVFERKKEISIFSAIGLAPNHIALLFFAEALVLGIIGAVGGYLVSQGVAYFITVTGALPSLYLNFSSTSAVLATGIVLSVVLISAAFPAHMAKKIAAPALDESIAPPEAGSDSWTMILPFRVTREEAPSLLAHLAVWFRAYQEYSIGDFVTAETEQGQELVATTAWLAPYDLGVSQRVRITSQPTPATGVYELSMEIERLTGEPRNWVNLNKTFMADVRRQCLAWRA